MILFCFLLVFGDTFLIFWVALGHLVGTFCFFWIVRGLLVALFTPLGPSGGHFGDHFGTLGDIFGLLGASLVVFLGLLGTLLAPSGPSWAAWAAKVEKQAGESEICSPFWDDLGKVWGVKTTPQNDQKNGVQKVSKRSLHSNAVWTKKH